MLQAFLQRMFTRGRLTVRLPNGRVASFGDGTGEEVVVRLNARAVRRIGANPELGMGESYMDGDAVMERGGIWDLLELFGRNRRPSGGRRAALSRLILSARRRLQQWNDRDASRRNVHHHYDLSYDLYRRFLDADMQYSCAYFARPDMTLEEAQAAKKAHIAAKLRLEPGMKVLDIGCGWGGMALELARSRGVQVLGVTLAEEQLQVARRRAEEAGLSDRVRFSLTDFRDVAGPFDRIVSVGMFEHVGTPNFYRYFDDVARLLTDDGVAVIHSIGRNRPPTLTSPWVAKYVFPGGYIPALSETLAAVEEVGLWVTDIEILRLHYAETVRHWRARFAAERGAIAGIYDERFCRMWEFYLAAAELALRYGDQMNFQLQLTKRMGVLPMTRDYILDAERAGPRTAQSQAAE